jgi:hypothetical protein
MTNRRLTHDVVRRLLVDTGAWLSCDECFERLDEYVERLVLDDLDVVPGMRGHLLGCPACGEEAATLALLVAEDHGHDPAPVLAALP